MGWCEDRREETREEGRRRKVLACAHRLDRVGETKVFQKLIDRRVRSVCTLCVSIWQLDEIQTAKHSSYYRKLYSGSDDQFL